ncbi:MAG: hypothetical protein QXK49_02095 [Candidatus Aenigmatarchaeota archaeon]
MQDQLIFSLDCMLKIFLLSSILLIITVSLCTMPSQPTNHTNTMPENYSDGRDSDKNKIDDYIDINSGSFDISVGYDIHPTENEINQLSDILKGTNAEITNIYESIDYIAVRNVQKNIIYKIANLPHVTKIENEFETRAVK